VSRDLTHDAEAGASSLDDESDRAELRDRYYGLMQELRVLVTGVQVLLAFLLTVPFAQRFVELDESQQAWFGAALTCATCSVIAFVTPAAMHRIGKRTARGDRLALSIVTTRIGLFFLGLAMLLSFAVVVDFLYHGIVPALLVASITTVMVGAWVVLPFATRIFDRD